MEPSIVFDTYQWYKAGTKRLYKWLVSKSRTCRYVIPGSEAAEARKRKSKGTLWHAIDQEARFLYFDYFSFSKHIRCVKFLLFIRYELEDELRKTIKSSLMMWSDIHGMPIFWLLSSLGGQSGRRYVRAKVVQRSGAMFQSYCWVLGD